MLLQFFLLKKKKLETFSSILKKMLQYILYCSVCQKPLQICYLLQHFINIAKQKLYGSPFEKHCNVEIVMHLLQWLEKRYKKTLQNIL